MLVACTASDAERADTSEKCGSLISIEALGGVEWMILRGEWGTISALSIVALRKHTLALPEIQDVQELQQPSAIPFRELIKIRWGTESKLAGGCWGGPAGPFHVVRPPSSSCPSIRFSSDEENVAELHQRDMQKGPESHSSSIHLH